MEYEIRDVPLADFPGYRVSSAGEVFGKLYTRPMTPTADKDGYLTVQLRHLGSRKTAYISHLVLLAFHGPKPIGMECLHGPDPTRTNNRADNLRWGTRTENMRDINPESLASSKLVWDDIDTIRSSTLSVKCLSKKFGVSKTVIHRVLCGTTWHPERRPVDSENT